MPSVSVTWSPRQHHMFWAAFSRALRVPSRNDTNLEVNFGTGGTPDLERLIGNPDFQDEGLYAYETGYRTTWKINLSVDTDLFFNDYDHLQTSEPLAPFLETTPSPAHEVQPFTFENLMYGNTYGIEI